MATLLHFVAKFFDGAPPIEVQFRARKKRLPMDYDTGVRLVEILLNDPKNRSIILSQWWNQEKNGQVPGMPIETDCLCLRRSCKSCVEGAIKVKPLKKTKGENYAKRMHSTRNRA